MKMKLNLSLPDEYSWSVNLEVYEIFVIGTLQWLKMNGLLREEYTGFQVDYLGTRLKSNALEWYTRKVERHDRPIKKFYHWNQ